VNAPRAKAELAVSAELAELDSVAFPGLKIQTWGTQVLWLVEKGRLKVVLSHPSDKNKDVARVGHPECWRVSERRL